MKCNLFVNSNCKYFSNRLLFAHRNRFATHWLLPIDRCIYIAFGHTSFFRLIKFNLLHIFALLVAAVVAQSTFDGARHPNISIRENAKHFSCTCKCNYHTLHHSICPSIFEFETKNIIEVDAMSYFIQLRHQQFVNSRNPIK